MILKEIWQVKFLITDFYGNGHKCLPYGFESWYLICDFFSSAAYEISVSKFYSLGRNFDRSRTETFMICQNVRWFHWLQRLSNSMKLSTIDLIDWHTFRHRTLWRQHCDIALLWHHGVTSLTSRNWFLLYLIKFSFPPIVCWPCINNQGTFQGMFQNPVRSPLIQMCCKGP